jgi:N-acetylneuraminate synthase
MAAWMLGAEWIERHFVDDRATRHTDAAASLEPSGLRRLIRDLDHVSLAMTQKDKMSAAEEEQRKKLAYCRDLFGE